MLVTYVTFAVPGGLYVRILYFRGGFWAGLLDDAAYMANASVAVVPVAPAIHVES